MKYFLLSHALGFERLFDSVEELTEYVWAKTGSAHLNADFIKAHLQENSQYSFTSWGIDLAVYKRLSDEGSTRSDEVSDVKLLVEQAGHSQAANSAQAS